MATVKVMFFGPLVDITGRPELEVDQVQDTEELLAKLSGRFPPLSGTTFLLAVDRKTVAEQTLLRDGNVVALLPPFSGG